MVFSSPVFLFLFLPPALCGYFALRRSSQRARNLWLALSGYYFYGWANPWFIFLMFGTTFVDWLASLVIARNTWNIWDSQPLDSGSWAGPKRSPTQRAALLISLISNLSVLGFFKYFHFGSRQLQLARFVPRVQRRDVAASLRVILPLGISFYTFQSLSYIIDVYRGDAEGDGQLHRLLLFRVDVSASGRRADPEVFVSGDSARAPFADDREIRDAASRMFSLGLGKKVLLANPCGHVADAVFGAGRAGVSDAWYGIARVRISNLLRLQRLFRHGDRVWG